MLDLGSSRNVSRPADANSVARLYLFDTFAGGAGLSGFALEHRLNYLMPPATFLLRRANATLHDSPGTVQALLRNQFGIGLCPHCWRRAKLDPNVKLQQLVVPQVTAEIGRGERI